MLNDRRTELEARDDLGITALILAAKLEIENVVEQLIQSHVDVNATDINGKSALHWAAEINNKNSVELLLKHGANKDIQNEREETPLFLAAKEGSLDCVNILLQHFANRDITDFMDRLPRDIAAQKMHHDIVDILDKPIAPSHGLYDGSLQMPFSMGGYNPKQKIPNSSKKRPRQGNQARVSAGKRSKKSPTSLGTVSLYSKSSGNLSGLGYGQGLTGSTTLSPPSERSQTTGSFHTLQPRLQHSQSIAHGLPHHAYHLMGAHAGVGAAADLNSSMPFHSSSLYESNWMTQKHMMYSQHRYSQITHSIHSPVSNQASYPL